MNPFGVQSVKIDGWVVGDVGVFEKGAGVVVSLGADVR